MIRRSLALGVALLALLAGPLTAAAQTAPKAAEAAPVPPGEGKIEGFRSAKFGMNEADVRKAIAKDFPAVDKVEKGENPTERTAMLSAAVKDLLPDTGRAQVVYILGYQSKALIQVNVVWGGPANPGVKAEALVQVANQLRNYFAGQGYKPETVVQNAQMGDGSILAFRGQDSAGRLVALVLSNVQAPKGADGKAPPLMLQLSYVANPASPDIFRLPAGQF
ncbi:MAG TPA: hypothetical protein VEH84_10970 [Alphaproteobacteria bacterium]|nr:hypothetical protein [Alphaproteobacteria bacterium]